MLKRIFILTVILILPASIEAAPTPAPSSSEMVCSDPFPCPPELRGRIQFWIDVFSKWGATHRIFHDNGTPERVYSVIETTDPCSKQHRAKRARPENSAVEKERKRVKERLTGLAQRLEITPPVTDWSEEEKRILNLFPDRSPATIREASENIRCQEGNRDRFQEGLASYVTHRKMVVQTFANAGLPTDLQYLPFVESSYNPRALSRLNAAGLWQFMPRAARLFGLKVNDTLDERFDPEKATLAATKYLRMSFDDLGATAVGLDPEIAQAAAANPAALPSLVSPFAITSYNYGLAGVRNAMKTEGTNYVKVLYNYNGKRFRTAVQNFYSSFLAARHVAVKMTPNLPAVQPSTTDQITVPKKISAVKLADHLNLEVPRLREMNLSLTRSVWKGRRPIPEGYVLKLPKREGGWDEPLASLWKIPMEAPVVAEDSYRVKPGDTPCGIANRFSIPCSTLVAANDLGPRAMIRSGQILSVPAPKKISKPVAETSPVPATPTSVPQVVAARDLTPTADEIGRAFGTGQDYTVKGNIVSVETDETIGHYAEWLGLSNTQPIRGLNKLLRGESLRLGQSVQIPLPGDEARTTFERRRTEYHRTLEDEFHQHYEVAGTEPYTVKQGDTEWVISDREEVPLWLLKRFNPDLLKKPLKIGDTLTLPTIQERASTNGNGK